MCHRYKLFVEAEALEGAGDYASAVNKYKAAMRISPKLADVLGM